MICDYCKQQLIDSSPKCDNCGAENPYYTKYKKTEYEDRKQAIQIERDVQFLKNGINEIEIKTQSLQNKINRTKAVNKKDDEEITKQVILAFKISIVTSFVATCCFTSNNPNADFGLIYFLFYIGNAIGNTLLTSMISAFTKSSIPKIIACIVFCVLGCFILNPVENIPTNNYEYIVTTHNTIKESQRKQTVEQLSTGVPCNGMTLEEVQSLKWGYKVIFTECRDFDKLRIENKYYTVKWYNSNFEVIATGQIGYNKDGSTYLYAFREF